ncbi:MAG: TatD family hydrolase [Methanolinea sp.]|nr:TatD family hydrolase [Methanolinea sp.]
MRIPGFPITDDHMHLDPENGRGLDAAKDFQRAGGTHLFLVSKPASSFRIVPGRGEDYLPVFDETLRIAEMVRELGLVVFPILGVHPAEISTLSAEFSPARAGEIMEEGLLLASRYVEEGRAVGLKSGRPHYEVSPDIWTVSNEVLSYAFDLAASCGCAVQVHAESGPCTDMVGMARKAGLPPEKVVKHYATPDTPLTPSFIARDPAIPDLAALRRAFTMESDYMDENSRPGAVIGPKSVPRITRKLLESGEISEESVFRIHTETPSRVYGVEISL